MIDNKATNFANIANTNLTKKNKVTCKLNLQIYKFWSNNENNDRKQRSNWSYKFEIDVRDNRSGLWSCQCCAFFIFYNPIRNRAVKKRQDNSNIPILTIKATDIPTLIKQIFAFKDNDF